MKYRDTGAKPATGRAGSASLEMRALVDKDHQTVIEVTTGSLEGGPPAPGTLGNVQVKVFDPQWHHVSTTNYSSGSGGHAEYRFAGLPPGSGLQVQANVRGIDANRTDVVTVRETVKLRPDLAAGGIAAPSHAIVGLPVTVLASVRELNGDVGARADCVLSVDGERVASADGIWVNAHGDVSCEFSLAFPTVGTKTLEVSIANVNPGDYDLGNNTRTSSILIESGVSGFTFRASGEEWTESFQYRTKWWFSETPNAFGTNVLHDETIDGDQISDNQYGFMFGFLDRELQFPIRNVQYTHTTGGNVLATKTLAMMEPTYFFEDENARVRCADYFEVLGGTQGAITISICTIVERWTGQDVPFTILNTNRQTGEVTYSAQTSNGSYRFELPDGFVIEGTWYSTFLYEQPRLLPHYGGDLTISMSFEAEGSVYRQVAAMPMIAFDRRFPDEDERCSEYTPTPTRQERVCFERWNWHRWGVEGSLTGTGTVEPAPGVLTP